MRRRGVDEWMIKLERGRMEWSEGVAQVQHATRRKKRKVLHILVIVEVGLFWLHSATIYNSCNWSWGIICLSSLIREDSVYIHNLWVQDRKLVQSNRSNGVITPVIVRVYKNRRVQSAVEDGVARN